MSMDPRPWIRYQPDAPLFDELNAWVARYLARFPDATWLHQEVVEMPGDAVGWLLGEHLIGEWELAPEEIERLWFIGRAMGWRRQDLLTDEDLQRALPGRGVRPPDPPGRWIQDVLLAGGAHLGGYGVPGKSEFPRHWDPDRLIDHCEDVVRQPSGAVALPNGDFRAYGEREQVLIGAVVSPDGELRTAYPVSGPGVVQNPLSEAQVPAVAVLEALLDELPLPPGQEPRVSLDELVRVGEWPHAIASVMALDLPWTEQQRIDLAELTEVAGMEIPLWYVRRNG